MESEQIPPTRREFLSGDVGFQGWTERSDQEQSSENVLRHASSRAGVYLQHFSRRAMACDFELFLNLDQYRHGAEAAIAALDAIDQVEHRLSIFRSDSELSRLNRAAHNEAVTLSPELFSLLQTAQDLNSDTAGAFDISITPLVRTWGFLNRVPNLPSQSQIAAALELVGHSSVHLDRQTSSVKYAKDGVEINLHGIGKGFAVECAANVLRQAGVFDFALHGGQSSVMAYGNCEEVSMEANGWKIGLSHPLVPETRLAEFALSNESLGTSGSARQGFVFAGQRYGHIIDPRTGWPARHWLSTTVIHPSATMSDALATTFFVMNEKEILRHCLAHPEIRALLIREEDLGGELSLSMINLDQRNFRLLCDSGRLALRDLTPIRRERNSPP